MFTRALFVILAFTALAIILNSCSTNENRTVLSAAPEPQGSQEWTVLFYGSGNTASDVSEDGRSQALSCVERFLAAPPAEDVDVLACVSSSATDGRTRLYTISAQDLSANSAGASDFADWGAMDMSSPQSLRNFIEYGIDNYPARKYALFIMGEGNGWRGVLADHANGDGLPMSLANFSQTIEASSAHFDLLTWMVPGMSMLEVAYECRLYADYMVGCAWPLSHDVSYSPAVWLTDLTVNPQMDGERLGMMVVDGLYEAATRGDDSVHYAMMRLSNLSALVPELDSLATALFPYTEDQTLELPSLWSAAWVAQTDDSQSVDVGRLGEGVLSDPDLADDPTVANAAQQVILGLDNLVIYHRTTVTGETRQGVAIFLPLYPDTVVLDQYAALSLSVDHTGWVDLLRTTTAHAAERITISGSVSWTAHELQNLYMFVNRNQIGAPSVDYESRVSITQVITPDNVLYEAFVTLEEDSLRCYVGLFEDLDNNGMMTSGDRYGYYHQNPSPPRDWITLRPGEHLENTNVELTLTWN